MAAQVAVAIAVAVTTFLTKRSLSLSVEKSKSELNMECERLKSSLLQDQKSKEIQFSTFYGRMIEAVLATNEDLFDLKTAIYAFTSISNRTNLGETEKQALVKSKSNDVWKTYQSFYRGFTKNQLFFPSEVANKIELLASDFRMAYHQQEAANASGPDNGHPFAVDAMQTLLKNVEPAIEDLRPMFVKMFHNEFAEPKALS